jgi:hypothetical protein
MSAANMGLARLGDLVTRPEYDMPQMMRERVPQRLVVTVFA